MGQTAAQMAAAATVQMTMEIPAETCFSRGTRVNRVLKEEAELVLYKSGISPSEAIDRFYRKVIEEGGLDFLGK